MRKARYLGRKERQQIGRRRSLACGAAFAAAAMSKEDPIATGFQGATYSLRTAILPFVFVFNPAMLLIETGEGWTHTILVAAASLIAILLFAAATMNWFVTQSRWWESAVLPLVCFTLFRPDWWLNQFTPPFEERPASEFLAAVEQAPADGRITFVVRGIDLMGDDVRKTVNIPIGDPGDPRDRLQAAGLDVTPAGDTLMITNVAFGSHAKRVELDVGYDIVALVKKADQPSVAIPIGIALAVTAVIAALQFGRRRAAVPQPARTPSANDILRRIGA